MTRRGTVIAWALVAAWAVVIFLMSANTGDDLTSGEGLVAHVRAVLMAVQAAWLGTEVDIVSSIAHFCEYLVFGALLQHALGRSLSPRAALLAAIVAASVYGVTDEVHQLFVPGRACDPVDWLVDTAGAALGAVIAWFVLRRRQAGPQG